MPCWSHRSETGVCSRRWSRSMATFSGTLKRLRVLLDMGKPPLETVAYSSALFFPFRLKQNTGVEELASLLRGESPRCAVIVAAAFFDERLKSLLADTTDGSFSARIKAALEWGLLTRNEHDDLDLLRQLRNGFAHDLRVKDFDVTSEARVEAMRTWQVAKEAWSLARVIQTPLDRLLFVVGVIAFRLQKRTKPTGKSGPRPEPAITDFKEWPPVTSI